MKTPSQIVEERGTEFESLIWNEAVGGRVKLSIKSHITQTILQILEAEVERMEKEKKNFCGDYEWASNYDQAIQDQIDFLKGEIEIIRNNK